MQPGLLVNLSMVFDQPTGISNVATSLFPHLQDLDPTLLTAQRYPGFACVPIPNNLTPAQGSKGHLRRLIWTQWQLPKIYQNLQGSLLFSPIPEAPIHRRIRSVVLVHDLIPLRFPRKTSPLFPYFKYYIPQVLQGALQVLANSQATAQDVQEFYGIPARKINTIRLAYDSQKFRFLDLPTQNYFLYIGRPDPHKNLPRLIQAFAQVPKHLGVELWMAGGVDRRYTPLLEQQIQELNLTGRVKFLSYVPDEDLIQIINGAIALVFPSLWEGFGLPVLEAMACGTPVITSNVSALPEVAGEAALLVNPYQVQEISDAMQRILTESQLASQLRQAGLKRAKLFSWEKTGQVTSHILKQYL